MKCILSSVGFRFRTALCHLVGLCRRTVIQSDSKCDSRRRFPLKGFPHEPRKALSPRPFVFGRAGVVWMHSGYHEDILHLNLFQLQTLYIMQYILLVSHPHLCACSSSPAQVWGIVDSLLWTLLYLLAASV